MSKELEKVRKGAIQISAEMCRGNISAKALR